MNQDQPVIIIKKRGNSHGHHGGAWKVAFADFMTAMMAFFLVMWILGLNQETRKSIAAYFNDPTGMLKSQAGGNKIVNMKQEAILKKRSATNGKEKMMKSKKDREGLEKAMTQIRAKIAESSKLRAFQKNIEITLSPEGLRIELLEDKEALFFENGSANLRPNTVELLREIGPVLAKLPNHIIVEGHTDARPYAGGDGGYSNWDLSADRANAARKALEPTLGEQQIREVRGYSSTRLRNADDPFHFSNRRISILVPSADYIEGVPVQQADEQGLVGLRPDAPNLEAEFAARMGGKGQGQ